MVAAQGHEPELAHQHTLLLANCLAQSEALMRGRSLEAAGALMAEKG
jgi:glucose-6-phosphate isomerase